MINTEKTIQRVKRMLGEPMVKVELDDEQMTSLLKDAQETFYLYAELAEMPISKQDKIEYQWIKKYFYASCKEALARVRGKFSGKISVPGSEDLQLDYNSLLEESESEKAFLKYTIFKDEAILRQANRERGILVFYIGIKSLDPSDVEKYLRKLKETIKPPKGFTAYYIATRKSDSKIECIYPGISDSKEGKEVITKLNDYLIEMTEKKPGQDEE